MLELIPIPAFQDNYLWLFRDTASRKCGIVDPGDATPVLHYLQDNDLELDVIFITHHHADHTGGIGQLLEHYPVPVLGPDSANIPEVNRILKQGDQLTWFNRSFSILEIPGHTLDHIAYYSPAGNGDAAVLFCGDTLFAGGCGRVFEGTYSMMYESLQKLAGLDPETRVYCAHEYTLANLAFARAVTPDSRSLAERIDSEKAKRSRDIPTVPTSIQRELETNPFLRCDDESVLAAASQHAGKKLAAPEEVFAAIRSWKDSF